MGLLDLSIYRNPPQSIVGAGLQGLNQGLMANDAARQRQQQQFQFQQAQTEAKRQMALRQAMDDISRQGGDLTTPEGQRAFVQGLAQRGFGQEAQAIAEKLPKPDLQPIDMGKKGYGVFDSRSGTIKPLTTPNPDGTPGQPFYSKAGQKEVDHDAKFAAFQQDLPRYGKEAASLGTDVNRRNALVSEIYTKYGDLPEAQKFIDDTKNTPPAVVSLGGLTPKDKLTLENRFRTDWRTSTRTYETQAQAFQNLMGVKSSKAYGTGIGDQSLIDEFVRLQTGGRPTEAQYSQAISSMGLGDLMDKISGKLKSGAKLSETQRQDILTAATEQMKNNHERLLALKDEKAQELKDSGGEPTHVFQSPKYFDQIGKYFQETPPAGAPASSPAPNVSPAMIDLAKKALSDPNAKPEYKAAAKKLLGIKD